MQAYSKSDLFNKYVTEQATDALQTNGISSESHIKIFAAYPVRLYTPNYFIRIALGILTIIAVLFSGLLLWLLTSASSTAGIITMLIILTAVCYATLEFFVRNKKYYNAGVDNILMLMTLIFFTSTFFVTDFEISWIAISLIGLLISLWLTARFTDAFMAVISYCSLLILVFLIYIKLGNFAKASVPLVMMGLSAAVYFAMRKLMQRKAFTYHFCFKSIALVSLITFYASGNYFVVKELSNEMFNLQLTPHDSIPFGWLFWIFTILIPPLYIVYGIIRKDFMFMRTGLGLIAVTIFTIKYYYAILPAEIEMLVAGVILVVISYVLMKYLATPKYGFTSVNLYPSKKEALNVEALIIAETFNQQTAVGKPGLYGGGSGGGGGASGDF